MKTRNSKINIIVMEGHDRTGKDTLMDMLDFNDFLVYKQPETEAQDTDYKNPEKFEAFMVTWIRKVLDDLYTMSKLNGTDRPIVMSRLWLTDNVFADLYNRNHVVEKYFMREIEANFDVVNYIMLWRNYEEYKSRVKMINGSLDFTPQELDDITSNFNQYKKSADYVRLIDATDTKEDIYDDFIATFGHLTPRERMKESEN